MELLKEKWMREIEVVNDHTQPLALESSFDAEEDEQFNIDGVSFDTDTSFIGAGAFDMTNLTFADDLMSQATGLSNHYPQMSFDTPY
jgi:hypothetical protein